MLNHTKTTMTPGPSGLDLPQQRNVLALGNDAEVIDATNKGRWETKQDAEVPESEVRDLSMCTLCQQNHYTKVNFPQRLLLSPNLCPHSEKSSCLCRSVRRMCMRRIAVPLCNGSLCIRQAAVASSARSTSSVCSHSGSSSWTSLARYASTALPGRPVSRIVPQMAS